MNKTHAVTNRPTHFKLNFDFNDVKINTRQIQSCKWQKAHSSIPIPPKRQQGRQPPPHSGESGTLTLKHSPSLIILTSSRKLFHNKTKLHITFFQLF